MEYKTFSEEDDVQDVLSILSTSDIHTSSIYQESVNGWRLFIKIWSVPTVKDIINPIQISFLDLEKADTVSIGFYNCTVDKTDCCERLLAFYEASVLEGKAY